METGTNGPVDGSGEQSVNAPGAQETSSAISSLANFRARQAGSTPAGQAQATGGEAGPNTGATPRPEREQFIPRERFDEVNTNLKGQVQALQSDIAALRQYIQSGPAPQQTPQTNSPTGMVGAQPRPQAPSVPDFNDPTVKQQWKDRLYKDPVGGMAELVNTLIQAQGAPMLAQFQQSILGQLEPIRQSFTQSQVQTYAATRAADTSFAAIKPTFDALVGQAVSNGIAINTQTLQAIEGIARAQAGVPFASAPNAPQAPFTEQPGGQGHAQPPITLTNEQREYARRFGMDEAKYAAKLKAMGLA